MSDDFRVHNFSNHSLQELQKIKEEFESLLNSEINYKFALTSLDDYKTLKAWYTKCEYHTLTDNDSIYDIAEEHFGELIDHSWEADDE